MKTYLSDYPPEFDWFLQCFLLAQYIIFALAFILDAITVRLLQPKVKENISIIRNIFHWLLAPIVLLGYSLVEFYALFEVMIKGKRVCKHGASKKENL